MTDTPQGIIPDERIEEVHGSAKFGFLSKRDVVNQGVLKAAFNYSAGHTQMTILHEHGLIRQFRGARGGMVLTVKGTRYLRAVYTAHLDDLFAKVRA